MACLTDSEVHQQLGDTDDHTHYLMRHLQYANNLALFQMDKQGFDGKFCIARLEVVPDTAPVPIKHSQARGEALAKAKTHGAKLTATGGRHIMSNEVLKVMEISTRDKDITDMEDDKKARKKLMEVQ